MTDRTGAPTPRRAARHPALVRSVLTLAAAAVTSAALVWSALFYTASQKQLAARASGAAPTAQAVPESGVSQPASSAVPVTTRTS